MENTQKKEESLADIVKQLDQKSVQARAVLVELISQYQ
jgi:hypothetical protein